MRVASKRAELIAKKVTDKYGAFFLLSSAVVQQALVRSEGWLIATQLDSIDQRTMERLEADVADAMSLLI